MAVLSVALQQVGFLKVLLATLLAALLQLVVRSQIHVR